MELKTVTGTAIASGLDVGTGTGILAAAMARLGVPRVVALDVDVGPMPMAVRGQRWSAPTGIELIDEVTIDEINEPGSGRYLRARITLPEFARPSVRADGRPAAGSRARRPARGGRGDGRARGSAR